MIKYDDEGFHSWVRSRIEKNPRQGSLKGDRLSPKYLFPHPMELTAENSDIFADAT